MIWPVPRYAFPASVPEGLDASWPALNALATAVTFSFLAVGSIGLVLGFAAQYLRRSWAHGVLLGALAILSVPRWGSVGEFVQNAIVGLIELAVIWWGAKHLVRLNFLAYAMLASLLSISPAIGGLVQQANAYFRTNGAILIAVVAVVLILPLVWWRAAARRRAAVDNFVVPV